MHHRLLILASFCGSARADGWDDFTNNLATDLAPLLALFGEQVTKQFLSESTTIWDNVIFAMAPLGIITAIVSAIRVCGGPSLRAFIGRAQEGGGVAEAELCSSTSRDVCELFHNGAIVRVFGRPKILEIFPYPDAVREPLPWRSQTLPVCGIYSFQQYIEGTSLRDVGWEEVPKSDILGTVSSIWDKTRKHLSYDLEESHSASDSDGKEARFSPNPNLSLNIGIKRLPRHTIRMASVFAFIAQTSVLVFGGLTTLWDWKKDGQSPPTWGLPLTLVGTILLCGGMFHCALLIERSTKERIFRRVSRGKTSNGRGPHESTMYVVQPGNQVIGDQTFDSFIFDGSANASHPVDHYTTSWKEPRRPQNEWGVWCAVTTTLFGFILQFVGLRAMHSAVSLLQLGVIILVSILRASLRTQRLREEDNLLHKFHEEIRGHELDWLAHCMTKDQRDSTDKLEDLQHPSWKITGQTLAAYSPAGLDSSSRDDGERLSGLLIADAERRDDRSQAGTIATSDRAVRTFYHRARLAELTSGSKFVNPKSSREWDEGSIEVRKHARQLKRVIESSSKILFRNGTQHSGPNAISLSWNLQVECSATSPAGSPRTILIPISQDKSDDQPSIGAEVNMHFLEAMLGLWSWSLISEDTDRAVERNNTEGYKTWKTPALRLLTTGTTETDVRNAEKELRLWYDHMIMSDPIIMGTPENFMRFSANKVWHEEVDEQGTVLLGTENLNRGLEGRRRVFGRQYTNQRSPQILVSRLSPEYSVSMACSHDIYQSFLYTILECFESIGGDTKSSKGIDGLYLVNDVIDGLVECFRESGLGTKSEAMALLFPVLQSTGKLPLPPRSWFKTLIVGQDQRNDGNLPEREYILQGAWVMAGKMKERQDSVFEAVMLEIGELYRKALFTGNEANKRFAEQGFEWMQSQKDTSTKTIKEIVDRYLEIAMTGVVPGPQPTLDQIASAIRESNRTETLRLVSLIRKLPPPQDMNHSILCCTAKQEWPEIVKVFIELGCEVDVQDKDKRTPLSYAAENGCIEVAEILLRNGARPMMSNTNGRTPISFAAAEDRVDLVQLLLKDRRVDLSGTDVKRHTPLHWAARHGKTGAIKNLLGQHADIDSTNINGETPLIMALTNGHEATAELLKQYKASTDISIDGEESWRWAVKRCEWLCLEFLLRADQERRSCRVGDGTQVHDEMPRRVRIMVIHPSVSTSKRDVALLATKQTNIVKTYLRLESHGRAEYTMAEIARIVSIGFESFEVWICVEMDGERDPERVTLKDGSRFRILGKLLEETEKGSMVTNEVVRSIAMSEEYGENLMNLLLDRRGREVTVTEEVVEAAAANGSSGEAIMKVLLNRREHEVTVTEAVVEAAAANEFSGEAIMKLLLDRRGQQVIVTEAVVQAAAANNLSGEAIMKLLLDRREHEVTVTEAVVKAAAANHWSGEAIMKLLLDRREHEVTVTEAVFEAAAANFRSGEAIMRVLLDRRDCEVTVTEAVVKAAAANDWSGEAIMEVLLDRRKHEVIVTEAVVKAAAANDSSGEAIMKLLLDRRGQQVIVTEAVVKAAAANDWSGEAIMKLLLDRREHEVTVTEAVVQAAAANSSSGEAIMKLLLDRREHEVVVTEAVVQAAAANDSSGEAIMKLLLDEQGH